MLANINFIGELFKVQMLTSNIMHYCITTLLDEKNEPDEEKIELLCKLLQSIGEKLDTPVSLAAVSTPPSLSSTSVFSQARVQYDGLSSGSARLDPRHLLGCSGSPT